MPRFAKKRDASHAAIREVFRQFGFLVLEGETIDFTLYDPQTERLYLADAKAAPNSRKTERQTQMILDGWPVAFPSSADEAMDVIRAWRRAARG